MHGTSFGNSTFAAKMISISGVASATGNIFSHFNGCKVVVGEAQFVLNGLYQPARGVSVVVQLGLGAYERLNTGFESLYAGVIGATFLTRNPDYILLQIASDTSFHVFFKDGRVAKVECKGLQVTANFLSPKHTLDIRLSNIADMFKKAETADDKVEKQTRTFFELAKLLRMSANHAALRKQITSMIGSYAKSVCNGELRPDVIRKLVSSIEFIGEDTANYWWINGGASYPQSTNLNAMAETPKSTINRRELSRLIREQHVLIDEAIEGRMTWESVAASFRRSAERGELGFSAQKRFCVNCTPGTGLSEEIGKLPLALLEADKKPSPLRSVTPGNSLAIEKARKNKRANEDRKARAEMKGPPRNDDSQKHGKKSKK